MTRAAAVRARNERALFYADTTILSSQDDVLEELAHQIGHKLRTPLNAVIGFSDMMRQELFGPVGSSRYLEYLDYIHESAQRMLQTAEETLSFTSLLASSGSVPTVTSFNLFAAAQQAALRAAEQLSRDPSSIKLNIPQSMEIWGDDEASISALTYLIWASLLNAAPDAEMHVAIERTAFEKLGLVLAISENTASTSEARSEDFERNEAGTALLKALAVSLLERQGSRVELATCETLGETISIELEISAQQAFIL